MKTANVSSLFRQSANCRRRMVSTQRMLVMTHVRSGRVAASVSVNGSNGASSKHESNFNSGNDFCVRDDHCTGGRRPEHDGQGGIPAPGHLAARHNSYAEREA